VPKTVEEERQPGHPALTFGASLVSRVRLCQPLQPRSGVLAKSTGLPQRTLDAAQVTVPAALALRATVPAALALRATVPAALALRATVPAALEENSIKTGPKQPLRGCFGPGLIEFSS
jgi:hypothetical protein